MVIVWALGISRGVFTPDSGVQCSIFPLGFQKIRPDNELFEVRDKPGPEMSNMAPSVTNSADLTDAREINFEYLKHVVLKFMSCRESEVEASESPVGLWSAWLIGPSLAWPPPSPFLSSSPTFRFARQCGCLVLSPAGRDPLTAARAGRPRGVGC